MEFRGVLFRSLFPELPFPLPLSLFPELPLPLPLPLFPELPFPFPLPLFPELPFSLRLGTPALPGASTSIARSVGVVAADETAAAIAGLSAIRSEERRVGKECVSRCRSRWWPYH